MFKIMCLSGVLKGDEFFIEDQELTIGRSKDCDVTVQDKKLSRKHCHIQNRNGSYFIVDLDSTNGLQVNDEWAKEELLKNGDYLKIGDSNFKCFSDEDTDDIYDAPTSAIERVKLESEEPEVSKEDVDRLILSETETTKVRKFSYETREKIDGFIAFFDVDEEA